MSNLAYANPQLPQHPLADGFMRPTPPLGPPLGQNPNYLEMLRHLFGGGNPQYPPAQEPITPAPNMGQLVDVGGDTWGGGAEGALNLGAIGPQTLDPVHGAIPIGGGGGYAPHLALHPAIVEAAQAALQPHTQAVLNMPPPPSHPDHQLTSHDLAALAQVLHGHAQRLFSLGG